MYKYICFSCSLAFLYYLKTYQYLQSEPLVPKKYGKLNLKIPLNLVNKIPLIYIFNFSTNSIVAKDQYMQNLINSVSYHEESWKIGHFKITSGFKINKFTLENHCIFVFYKNWNISDGFLFSTEQKYIVPEKNTIVIFKKGDTIETLPFTGDNFNFLCLYA